jgi:lytic murein transglycosylase
MRRRLDEAMMRWLWASVIASIALAATSSLARASSFEAFLQGLKAEAVAAGVGAATYDRETKGLTADLTLPDLILPGASRAQGRQAEFSRTPAEYLDAKLLASLSAYGSDLLRTHAATLAKIERDLGVDRHIVLAIWGRETSFGRYALPHDVIRVLATQAWLGRRKDMFKTELFAALKMIEAGVLDRRTMKASWAGALGLTQFMPSEYEALAYDGDGDGKKDIWRSIPDALGSAANQLKSKGWQAGLPWGLEVRLRQADACLLEGAAGTKPLSAWAAEGATLPDGKPLPEPLRDTPAFLLTVGGRHGPMFLVTENFMVLKRYNFADLYAVFVGHLADRLAGRGTFSTPWTTPKLLSNLDIEELQSRLQAAGFPIEKIDGRAGMNTRSLIGAFQKAMGVPVDCWPSATVLATARRQR